MLIAEYLKHNTPLNFEGLKRPKFHETMVYETPKNSIIHYLPDDLTDIGPDQLDFIYNEMDTSYVWHVDKLTSEEGRPRHVSTDTKSRIRAFHKQHRRLRMLRKFEQGVRDANNLVTVNYGLLGPAYKYSRGVMTGWNQWYNIHQTFVDNLIKVTDDTVRNQFVLFHLPVILPSHEELIALNKKPTMDSMEPFKSFHHFNLFWLWQYAIKTEHVLDTIPKEHAKLINFVFASGGKFTVLNLGRLQEWKEEHKSDKDDDFNGPFAKAFMMFLHRVKEQDTSVNNEDDFTEEDLDLDMPKYIPGETRAVEEKARQQMDKGAMSLPEYKRAVRLAENVTKLKAPDSDESLLEFSKVAPEKVAVGDTSITDIEGVVDKNMLASSLTVMDSKYISEVMERDIVGTVLSVQNAGIAVTGFKKEKVVDAANAYEHYSIQLTPLGGSPSTVHFKLPKVDQYGKFRANGVTYTMAKQRGDLPLRKTKSDKVALTSYYGKFFVTRTERSVYNRHGAMVKRIIARGENDKDESVTQLRVGNYTNTSDKLPLIYTGLANGIIQFKCRSGLISFDYPNRIELTDDEGRLKRVERRGHVLCGVKGQKLITVDEQELFHYHDSDGNIETIGGIEALIGEGLGKLPSSMVEIRIFNKNIPLGLALSYLLGFNKMIKALKLKTRLVPRGTKVELADGEDELRFADYTVVYNTDDLPTNMIMAGFKDYFKALKRFNKDDFERRDVYGPVLESRDIGLRYLRELELMSSMFIDPITLEILEKRKEPRTFEGLLIKSAELLKDDRTPDETDFAYMRIKGYERFAGFIYKELVAAIRKQQASGSTKSKVELNPKAVWMNILKDATTKPVEQLNPIHNLKEQELVTYTGDGGRSARSMVAGSRVYHANDRGVISEATVDSGSVAINSYLSANPNFASLRGDMSPSKPNESSSSQMLSTSAVISPGATSDDPKRVNFISIQNSHTVSSVGYQPMPLTTGYDKVLAHRVDPMFAFAARDDGKVVDVSDTHIEVSYKKLEENDRVELGTLHGSVTGTYVPHRIVTDLTKGQTFKKGHILTYNTGFFDRDYHDTSQVVWKNGVLATVALMESVDTLEDSCAISEDLGRRMATETTVVRPIVVDFHYAVNDLVQVGDGVDLESILCTLEDPITAENNYFVGDTTDALRQLAQLNPKAKNKGTVERIEVLYNGDVNDMSKSLRSIANKYDKQRKLRVGRLALETDATTGQIHEPINVGGTKVTVDKAVIKVYITKMLDAGVGDKGVVGNQLKTVIGRVMTGVNETETGEPIDVIFGRQSIANRIVLSPDLVGTTNKVLELASKDVADLYFKNL